MSRGDRRARAVFAPMGEDAHLDHAELSRGTLTEVIAAAATMPAGMHADIYVYVDDLTALPLAEAQAWANGEVH